MRITNSRELGPDPVWLPDPKADSNLRDFTQWLRDERGLRIGEDYHDLWSWSVDALTDFWRSIWDYFEVRSETAVTTVLGSEAMPGADWFPGTRINYVEHMLRATEQAAGVAIVDIVEGTVSYEVRRSWTWHELWSATGALAAALSDLGVSPGDRVVGYAPNAAELVVALLATASLGAVWACCGQDYAPSAAADRLAQLEPVVLIAADGYRFNGEAHDRRAAVADLRALLPTLRATISIDRLGLPTCDVIPWSEATSVRANLTPAKVAFSHPLWVLFSSGTTGLPKGIVHSHGGALLEHLKATAFNLDLRRGDRFFWYTSPSWMVWNYLVSGLLARASIVCYDGSPTFPGAEVLWDIVSEQGVTNFGTSPGHLRLSEQRGVVPIEGRDLSRLRTVSSSGSPLPPDAYRWVAQAVGRHIQVNSTSGGTDVVSAFAGSTATTPIWPGELSAPCLGVACDAWDATGRPVRDSVGELVVTRPMPSMPIGFWNDPDGSRYRDAYFSTFSGVWRHGDWITITPRGSIVFHGRSDSTLNRNGVRMGSADIYQAVERLPEISETLVVGVEEPEGGYWMPLFVCLHDGFLLTNDLADRIRRAVRENVSPRHVPDEIIVAPRIPHTRTGKKLEIPIKRLLMGERLTAVAEPGSVDDPEVLSWFAEFATMRLSGRRGAAAG